MKSVRGLILENNMNEQTKNNSNKTFLIVGVLALVSFAFYWFSIRPSNIRKECGLYAIEKSVIAYPYKDEQDTTRRTELQETLEAKLYQGCLSEKGL